MPRTFLYRCPNTSQTVQGWSADEVTDEGDTYQSFQCMACTRVHLVNLKTGKVLGRHVGSALWDKSYSSSVGLFISEFPQSPLLDRAP
jgi:hypothetical protein